MVPLRRRPMFVVLATAIKAGKKLEHFSIAQTAKQATRKAPKKVRRAKKR